MCFVCVFRQVICLQGGNTYNVPSLNRNMMKNEIDLPLGANIRGRARIANDGKFSDIGKLISEELKASGIYRDM